MEHSHQHWLLRAGKVNPENISRGLAGRLFGPGRPPVLQPRLIAALFSVLSITKAILFHFIYHCAISVREIPDSNHQFSAGTANGKEVIGRRGFKPLTSNQSTCPAASALEKKRMQGEDDVSVPGKCSIVLTKVFQLFTAGPQK